jgi:hypothetical protein
VVTDRSCWMRKGRDFSEVESRSRNSDAQTAAGKPNYLYSGLPARLQNRAKPLSADMWIGATHSDDSANEHLSFTAQLTAFCVLRIVHMEGTDLPFVQFDSPTHLTSYRSPARM